MSGIFGSMFDLDHDGQLSTLERAMEFGFLEEIEGGGENDDFWDYEDDDNC